MKLEKVIFFVPASSKIIKTDSAQSSSNTEVQKLFTKNLLTAQ